ncbi:HAD hydrolase family protein [Alteribacillus iranensis]|uniref:Cof subfamily of IIB subfamily of haloacid dehalogenase superfamily/HAD-superfamily hydrolase, subfamily IIB n=1 Tax=Alteribacillus iranensis TaxID=930128 RepID=A0A1I1Z3H8_9BACI|nr:HAD hydrolase family protein [Alteribacillus iranensis]SFE26269.1 hypothetical protein SAMN05192532_10119 [Alteribacillus iranensis]
MAYRLLAMSIDGVLLKSNERISKETKEAMDLARSKGVYTLLVTNRSFSSARKIARQLKMEHEMITHGGALLAGAVDRPILENKLPPDVLYDITEIMELHHCRIQLEGQDYELENKPSQPKNMLGRLQYSLTEGLFQSKSFTDAISKSVYDRQLSALRIFGEFDTEADAGKCRDILLETIPGIRIEQKDNRLTIKKEQASKEYALSFLMNELDITDDEMIYIGSGSTDEAVIEMAGLGVAMGQSPESIRRKADWVTRSNDQDGMAYMIKEVFRKQMRVEV